MDISYVQFLYMNCGLQGCERYMSIRRQDTIRQLFADKLRDLRLHQKTLVPVLGVSPSAITRKMKGETPFSDDEVQRVSRFLNIPELFHYPIVEKELHSITPPYDPLAKVIHDGVILLTSHDKKEFCSLLAFLFECKLPHANVGAILRALARQAT